MIKTQSVCPSVPTNSLSCLLKKRTRGRTRRKVLSHCSNTEFPQFFMDLWIALMQSEPRQNYTVFKWSLDQALRSHLKLFFSLKSQSRNYIPLHRVGKTSSVTSFFSQLLLSAPFRIWRKLWKARVGAGGIKSNRGVAAAVGRGPAPGDRAAPAGSGSANRLLPTAVLGSSPFSSSHSQGLALQTEMQERFPLLSAGNSKHPPLFFFSCCCADRQGRCQGTSPKGAGRPISEARICCRLWHDCNLLLAYHHQKGKKKQNKPKEKKNTLKKKHSSPWAYKERLNLVSTQ